MKNRILWTIAFLLMIYSATRVGMLLRLMLDG